MRCTMKESEINILMEKTWQKTHSNLHGSFSVKINKSANLNCTFEPLYKIVITPKKHFRRITYQRSMTYVLRLYDVSGWSPGKARDSFPRLSPWKQSVGTIDRCITFNSITIDSFSGWFQDSLADGFQITSKFRDDRTMLCTMQHYHCTNQLAWGGCWRLLFEILSTSIG
jgi:hypothetical protein